MKAKYLVYLVILSLTLRVGINLMLPFLAKNGKMEPFTFGYIGGGINILIFVSIIGLLIKIFKYQNKNDFLNS